MKEKLKGILISHTSFLETEKRKKNFLEPKECIKIPSNSKTIYDSIYYECRKLHEEYYGKDYKTTSSLIDNSENYPTGFIELKEEYKSVYVKNTTVLHITYFYEYIYDLICEENYFFESYIDNMLYKNVFELVFMGKSNIFIRTLSRMFLYHMVVFEDTHINYNSVFRYIRNVIKDIFLFNTVIYIDSDVIYLSDESEIDDILKILNDGKIELRYKNKTNKLFIDRKKWMEFDDNDDLVNYCGIRI